MTRVRDVRLIDRPYTTAIQTLKFCHLALDYPLLPDKELLVLLFVRDWAVAILDQLVRSAEEGASITSAVTAEEFGEKTYARLREQAIQNRAEKEARLPAVRRIMAEHAGPERLIAEVVRQKLSNVFQLSVRTIQIYMKEINAESSASR